MGKVETMMQTKLQLKPEVALFSRKKQVGLLGGNFNPVHTGHLVVAQTVLDTLGLDRVDFLPSFLPPHVDEKKTISASHRLKMLELALADNPNFGIETTEIKRKGKSYTIDTMKELQQNHPENEYFFIIGGDMVDYLPKWKQIEELLTLVRFVGVKRPDAISQTSYPMIYVDVPQLAISSSLIRQKVRLHQSPRYLLPENVLHYIEEKGLYLS